VSKHHYAIVPGSILEQFVRTLGQSGGALSYTGSLRIARAHREDFAPELDAAIVELDPEQCIAEVVS
jgi:hypothetical protein